jgi:hypothetical protein
MSSSIYGLERNETDFKIYDVADTTKQIKFEAGGTTATSTTILAAQTADRTVTLPDATGTIVMSGVDNDLGTSDITTGGKIVIDVDGTAINADGSITFGVGNDDSIYHDGTSLTLDAATSLDMKVAGTSVGTWDVGGIDLVTGDTYAINSVDVLTATTLGSSVVNSSLTSVGTLTTLTVDDITVNGNTISSAGASALTLTATAGQALSLEGVTIDGGVVDSVASLDLDASGALTINGANIISDSAGTATLSNIDALDATTEATIEAAIDTLSNLTTVGALNSGSITSGFGNIDVGASTIDTTGTITGGGLYVGTGTKDEFVHFESSASDQVLKVEATNATFGNEVVRIEATRAANSGYDLIAAYSGAGADTEFKVRGDGEVFGDGSSYNTPADYAEFFESKSGEALAPGTCVKLVKGKVVEASEGDDVIGVVRPIGTSSLVGNSYSMKWKGKYLRDDFGAYKLDEEGQRILSPKYKPNKEYVPRSERPEWNIIGLLGQVQILKGQPVNPRWIKMESVNKELDLYFIR